MKAIESLFDLATGGSDVADSLSQHKPPNELVSLGDSPAGVDASIEWFRSKLTNGEQVALFLVGGPGGGKSHATKKLITGLEEIGSPTTLLAHRKHSYRIPGSANVLTVINDATIPGKEHQDFPLLSDLTQAISNGDSVICCVNRGVLLEESQSSEPEFSRARELVDLLQSDSEIGAASGSLYENVRVAFSSQINFNGRTLEVGRVAFDIVSVFEEAPEASIATESSGRLTLSSSKYRLTKYQNRIRTLTPIKSVAENLLHKVASAIKEEYSPTAGQPDPIQANFDNLLEPQIRASISAIARASEVVSGKKFSYRELWGLVARLILGDLPERMDGSRPDALLVQGYDTSSSPKNKFEHLATLGDLRYFQAMFGIKFNHQTDAGLRDLKNPVLRLLSAVDPTLDMLPGEFNQENVKSGWATPINDAFASAISSESPLAAVLNHAASQGRQFAVSGFDRVLDQAFVDVIALPDLDAKTRSKYLAWYSSYLTRMYACSLGIPAFLEATNVWTDLWVNAPIVPNYVKNQLSTLVKPARFPDRNQSSLIPLYDSRALPVLGDVSTAKLGLQVSDIEIGTQVIESTLTLTIDESGKRSAHVVLDFALLREALASTNGHAGATDVTAKIAPRLERLRAANLVSSKSAKNGKLHIIDSDIEEAFQVHDNG